jgi:hypothetical protein
MDDLSPSKLSAEQVHKIAILDIRLLNADRNAANLLVRRTWEGSLELVPIDHGYCLRAVPDVSWMDWCWLDWPQLKQVRVPLGKEKRSLGAPEKRRPLVFETQLSHNPFGVFPNAAPLGSSPGLRREPGY